MENLLESIGKSGASSSAAFTSPHGTMSSSLNVAKLSASPRNIRAVSSSSHIGTQATQPSLMSNAPVPSRAGRPPKDRTQLDVKAVRKLGLLRNRQQRYRKRIHSLSEDDPKRVKYSTRQRKSASSYRAKHKGPQSTEFEMSSTQSNATPKITSLLSSDPVLKQPATLVGSPGHLGQYGEGEGSRLLPKDPPATPAMTERVEKDHDALFLELSGRVDSPSSTPTRSPVKVNQFDLNLPPNTPDTP